MILLYNHRHVVNVSHTSTTCFKSNILKIKLFKIAKWLHICKNLVLHKLAKKMIVAQSRYNASFVVSGMKRRVQSQMLRYLIPLTSHTATNS